MSRTRAAAATPADTRRAVASLAEAEPVPYWLAQAGAPEPAEPMYRPDAADLAVVGGGFTGLWTALIAKERDPSREVVLLEAESVGWAASGRNGGFCSASLTHGKANGRARFSAEFDTLERLGRANLDAIEATLLRYGIECDFERTGELTVATRPWQLAELAAGGDDLLDTAAVRAELDSPTYLGGVWDRDGCALVDPARLAWGLRQACQRLGVRIYEGTPVSRIVRTPRGISLRAGSSTVEARHVALATGAHGRLLRRVRPYILPVYDYVLMTEPLSPAQLASIGWSHRPGVADAGNQFHYYRLTADNRILWGGYDAVYYAGGRIRPSYEQRPTTHEKLAVHFAQTFPQLESVRFTHRWAGVIDTCSRFCAFFGQAYGGRLSYVVGYTGQGVGASRFGAEVLLDLLSGRPTPLTRLQMVRTKPLPFPPEPLRTAVVQATRWSIARADENEGRRNAWLRLLDRMGFGFDS